MKDLKNKDIEREIKNLPKYEKKEEILNIFSHLIGTIFGVVVLIILLIKSIQLNNMVLVFSSILYSLTFIELFLASTIYHSTKNIIKRVKTQKLDHLSINFFIFGSVNMFLTGALRTRLAYLLSFSCFVFSVISIVLNIIDVKEYRAASMIIYVITGWIPIILIKDIYNTLTLNGTLLLVISGLIYTLGLTFYGIKKKYMHFIWHMFVLIAAILMFFSILYIFK